LKGAEKGSSVKVSSYGIMTPESYTQVEAPGDAVSLFRKIMANP
jgi:hypothetical protein